MPSNSTVPSQSLLGYAFDSLMPLFPSKSLYYFDLYFVRTHRRRKESYANLLYTYIYIYIYKYAYVDWNLAMFVLALSE